jgi:hypothetical protein
MEVDMEDLIRELARWRTIVGKLEVQLNKARSVLDATWEAGEVRQAEEVLAASRGTVFDLEIEVRTQALAAYKADGNKHPHGAVSIKVFTPLEYDPAMALAYCRERLPEALKLDVKLFERVAKMTRPVFVTEKEVPRADIAGDLSAYADAAEVSDAVVHQ